MKCRVSTTLLVLAGLLTTSCQSIASDERDDHTIMPGIGIGIIKLGMNRKQITDSLGNRDGKYSLPNGIKVEYSQWKDPDKTSTIRVFFKPDGTVAQLSCEADVPATADGISTRSSLADVTKRYKNLQRFKYRAKDGRIDYYDDVKKGIAFEFTWAETAGESAKRLYAVIVHTPGKSVIADSDERPVRQ